MTLFDLTIFPLSLETGREQHELPGLFVISAPRKAARMRAQDQLLLYCKLLTTSVGLPEEITGGKSSMTLTPAQQQEILKRLAETYFNFSGSVTAGLRAVVARLNEFLLNRNLKSAQEGQMVAILNLAVVHADSLIVAHSGPTHSFVLTRSQVLHLDDGSQNSSASLAGRGLGLGRQAPARFYQVKLEAGDLLVICADPPASWTPKLFTNSPQLSFDHLRRRLLNEAGADLQAAVVRFQAGKGQVTYWQPGERSVSQSDRAGSHDVAHTPTGDSSRLSGRPSPSLPRSERHEPSLPAAGQSPAAEPLRPPEPRPVGSLPPVHSAPDVQTGPVIPTPEPARSAGEPAPGTDKSESTAGPAALHSRRRSQPAEKHLSPVERLGIFLGQGLSRDRAPKSTPPQTASPAPRPSRPLSTGQQPDPAVPGVEPVAQRPDPASLRPGSTSPRQEPAAHRPEPVMQQPMTAAHKTAAPGTGETTRAQAGQTAAARVQSRPERERTGERQLSGPPAGEGLRLALSAFFMKVSAARARAGGAVSSVLRRALPDRFDAAGRPQPLVNLSTGAMLAIAIFVPLVVVAVATTVYFRVGNSNNYRQYYAEAEQAAKLAAKQKNPIQQRESWTHVYELASKAAAYEQTDESQALKRQALSTLDSLDGLVRVEYQTAISSGFTADVKITRIVTTLNDVYLLDSGQGRILRLYRTASGYEVDPKFVCGAGKAGSTIIGPLIDLVTLSPNNSMHSTVMGIDANGILEYCSPNSSTFDSRPLARPDQGWGKIAGVTLLGDTLYVLDPKGNAVYRYDGKSGEFPDPPHLYFDNVIPQMADVIDLAVDQEFLYMLHASGRMTVCDSGAFTYVATKCTDPAPYGDGRAGYEPSPLSFLGSRFTQIQTTQPPEPSLFALDEANKSVYHLSLRLLKLQRQYRPIVDTDFPLPSSAPTAFSVAPNRRILLAFGNQIYFATIP